MNDRRWRLGLPQRLHQPREPATLAEFLQCETTSLIVIGTAGAQLLVVLIQMQ